MALLLWLPVYPLSAEPQRDDAESWLEHMVTAARMLNYEGTFVYRAGSDLHSMRVINTVSPKSDEQRLYSLDGDGQEVVRRGGTVTVLLPDGTSLTYDKDLGSGPFPLPISRDLEKLHESYGLRLDGWDRVAGRPVRGVRLVARDSYRYGYRLGLDRETGMLLRSDLLTKDGEPLEQLMFTDIRFGPAQGCASGSPGVITSSIPSRQDTGMRRDTIDESDAGWHITELPRGFEEKSHVRQAQVGDLRDAEIMMVSDGLASVSIYVGRYQADGEPLNGGSRIGAVNAYGTTFDGYQILAVGEVPAVTVKLLAEAIVPVGQ